MRTHSQNQNQNQNQNDRRSGRNQNRSQSRSSEGRGHGGLRTTRAGSQYEDNRQSRYPNWRSEERWSDPGQNTMSGSYSEEQDFYRRDESDGGEFRGRGPKGFKRSDDRIREQVCEALEEHSRIDASEIEVDVNDGEVTLRGTIEDRRTKRLAEECIEDLRGVKDVRNELRVQSREDSSERTSDRNEGSRAPSSMTGGQHSEPTKNKRAA